MSFLPSRTDPVARLAAEFVGGPVGRHARTPGLSGRGWTFRVLAVATLTTAALGYALKVPCTIHPWSGGFQYTHLCYSDVQALYGTEGLDVGKVPYLDTPVEYPPLLGFAMYGAAWVTRMWPPAEQSAAFVAVNAVLLAAAALAVVFCTALTAGRMRAGDAALVALAPVIVLHLLTNWDLLAVAFASAGLLAWSRRRPGWCGFLLGLGTATKLYPLLVLVAFLALAWRARNWRPAWVATGCTVATAALVVVPTYLVARTFGPHGEVVAASPLARISSEGLHALAPHTGNGVNAVWRFVALNEARPADWDSLWFLAQHVRGRPIAVPVVNAGSAIAFASLVAGITVLALRAPRPPRLGALCFLLVTAFLLTNKVDSPQYVLWLLPLAVLARPRWPMFLVWQLTECCVLLLRFQFFLQIGPPARNTGVDEGQFLTAVAFRDLALLTLAGLVVAEVLRPRLDVVRRASVRGVDPAAGLLAA